VFTSWLSAVNSTWKTTIGISKLPNWPVGTGYDGSGAVVGAVGSIPGAIGYAELNYAQFGAGVTYAAVLNPTSGQYVLPSVATTEPAANAISGNLPAGNNYFGWQNVSMLNQAGAYPIATFTYLMVYQDMGTVFGSSISQSQAQATVNFIWWVIHDGQGLSANLYYVPLPDSVVTSNQATLNSMTWNGATYSMPS
jgi:ABC-type phosphate transport system substrate-binding protein